MCDDLLEPDERLAVPGVGRWMVDRDEGGVTMLFHGQLVGQVEDTGLVGLYCSAHGRNPRAFQGSADERPVTSLLWRVLQCSEVAAFRSVRRPDGAPGYCPSCPIVLSL